MIAHNKINETLAKRVRQHRKQAGMSQEQLAKAISLTRTQITNYESGEVNFEFYKVLQLASIFNFSLNDLIPLAASREVDEEIIKLYQDKINHLKKRVYEI